MPTSASSSTIASSSVSIARYAISTAVIGLPTPVDARLAATSGASVGAGSGNVSTAMARAIVTPADRSAARIRSATRGVSARAAASVRRSRADARTSSNPVRPPPIAASVSATSTPRN